VQIVGFGGVLLYIRQQRQRYGGPEGSLVYWPAGSPERAFHERIRSGEVVRQMAKATSGETTLLLIASISATLAVFY